MTTTGAPPSERIHDIVLATGEEAIFAVGERVRVRDRSPVGHYRVPSYLRGKAAVIEAVIDPPGVNNEEEGFGRNAGMKRHYYRVALPMRDIWPAYAEGCADTLRIEVFENWLEGAAS